MRRRNDPVQRNRLITIAIFENDAIVYVKDARNERDCGICFWTKNAYHIETLDTVYENMESLTIWMIIILYEKCGKHAKNCALRNVFKIFN